ncbi:neuronal acetylcholine receptor subunit alpha-7-like [Haliotis rufescens]|uniref:neuronal acetylcholine receptor subunit alpha-7-like n=1 Tax=Haliotis rufescens TaxID=6454 RepID=UPI00201F27F3|nr:neuronal acetylcholine receptor subunit alpha-7-like [Haliotis rufescens]
MACYVKISVVTIGLIISLVRADTVTRDVISHLRKDLLAQQDNAVPPFKGNSKSVDVSLSFTPVTILDLNSVTQMLSVTGYLKVSWLDSRLTWNVHNHSDVRLMEVRSGDIWTPTISVGNSVSDMNPVETQLPVVVMPQGNIIWQVLDVFRTVCKINVSRFPFDTQHCKIVFAPSYGYNVKIIFNDEEVPGKDKLDENGEWKMLSVSQNLSSIQTFEIAEYMLTLERKYVYYFINFLFPMGLMSILNPFVFLIPARSGEKLGFLMAVFVSHTMFLSLIHGNMPPTSDRTSRLSLYLLMNEIQGFLTIFASIIVLVVHHQKEEAQTNTTSSDTKSEPCGFRDWERFIDCVLFVVSLIMAGGSILILCI